MWKPKTALSRYALSYTAFFVFLLLIMGGFMYARFSFTVQEQYEKSGAEKVAAVAAAHRVQWDLMQSTADQMMASEEFTPFQYEKNPLAAYELMRRLQSNTAVSNFYTKTVFLYRTDDHIYTGTTASSAERALSKGLLFERLTQDEARSLIYQTTERRMLPLQYVSGYMVEEGKYLCYIFPLANRKNAVMLFFVPKHRLEKCFSTAEGDLLWCYDGNSELLYGSQVIPADFVVDSAEKGENTLTYGGVDYMSFDYSDQTLGVTYRLLQPIGTLTDAMRAAARTVLLFAITLSIPALLIIAFSSIRFGRKIHRIGQIVNPQGDVNSLESIEDAAKALASRTTLLDSVLDENVQMKRNKLIRRLVQDGANEALIQSARELGLDLSGSVFAVMLVGLRHDQRDGFVSRLNMQMGSRVWGIEMLFSKQALFLLSEQTEEAMELKVCKLEAEIRGVQSSDVIAVSAYHLNGSQIPLAYLEAQSAYDMRFLVDTDSLLRFDASISGSGLDYPENYIDALKFAIRTKKQENANNALTELIQYAKSKKLSMPGFRLMYNDIIHVLISECSERTFQENIAHMYNVFSLSQCLSIAELNDILSNLCTQLIKHEEPQVSVSTQMNRIANYIQENYNDPTISMGSIAQEHRISAVAFSLGFKEAMGMSPSDYLTMTRMEQAKRRLIETEATVRDIGIVVGYVDTQGFMRKFKAYTSMTPTQYRTAMRDKQHAEEDNE